MDTNVNFYHELVYLTFILMLVFMFSIHKSKFLNQHDFIVCVYGNPRVNTEKFP